MSPDIRKSTISGSWYPGNPETLRSQIQGYLQAVPAHPKWKGEVVALIAPHAGYTYSGGVAAYAYTLLLTQPFTQVVIVAPSHRHAFKGASVDTKSGYETPLGVVPVDRDLAETIRSKSGIFSYVQQGHAEEHSLEIQIPFLQETLKNFSIVPIIQGSQDRFTTDEIARGLVEALKGKKVLLVASTDLSHFHPYDQAKALDKKILDRVAAFDEKRLAQDLDAVQSEACGGGPMVTVMKTARLLGANQAQVLKYANSGDITGDRSGVVGYMAAALFRTGAGQEKKK